MSLFPESKGYKNFIPKWYPVKISWDVSYKPSVAVISVNGKVITHMKPVSVSQVPGTNGYSVQYESTFNPNEYEQSK